MLLSRVGTSDQIIICFDVILLDLLSRWLEGTEKVKLEEWERRLAAMAMLPEIRPELFR